MFVSVVVALVYTAASVMLTSMAGWALARYRFHGRAVVVGIILGTLTLPYFVVVIPQFIMVARDFKLANTWVALIVPPLFNSLGVLFMRQAFTMMPADLFDAARVEGVREWQIFLRVAMPMARPTLAALSIILFLHSWNNYLWPLLISSNPRMMTAPVALGSLIGLTRVSWGGIMVGAVRADRADARRSSSSCSATSWPASPPARSSRVRWPASRSRTSSSASAPSR